MVPSPEHIQSLSSSERAEPPDGMPDLGRWTADILREALDGADTTARR
ncbi:hypothetical protein ACWGLF_26810 [Streptomyces puniciscabiei]